MLLHQPTAMGVLDYLRRMMDLCRSLYRHDLESEYREAWEAAAIAIYGPLPLRARISRPAIPAETVQSPPRWRQQMLAKPYKKIIMRMEDREVLECGHAMWSIPLPGAAIAKRRRCAQCAAANKILNHQEAGGLGAPESTSPGSYGESGPRSESAAAILSRKQGSSVAAPTYSGVNAGKKYPAGDLTSGRFSKSKAKGATA